MATSLDCLELCRLCLVKEHVTVPIFKDGNDVQQIFLKIAACLPVKVSRDDKLPKKICTDCVCKVESFYQFWNTTANAEKQLLQWLGEVDDMGDKQEFVQVLNTNVMKQEQSSDNRLEGNFIQVEGQNSIEMSMIDNMSIITMPAGSEQQFTTVPMDTNGTVQTVQVVSGSSTHAAYDQGEMVEEVEESEEDDMDDGCDNKGLPVKEENEDDQGEQQTTYISVPVTCDEAGPSGLQQQKISDLTEMTLHQSADETGDPKSGSVQKRSSGRGIFVFERESLVMRRWQILEFDGKPYYAFIPEDDTPISEEEIPEFNDDVNFAIEDHQSVEDYDDDDDDVDDDEDYEDKVKAKKLVTKHNESFTDEQMMIVGESEVEILDHQQSDEPLDVKPIIVNGKVQAPEQEPEKKTSNKDCEMQQNSFGEQLYQVKVESGGVVVLEKLNTIIEPAATKKSGDTVYLPEDRILKILPHNDDDNEEVDFEGFPNPSTTNADDDDDDDDEPILVEYEIDMDVAELEAEDEDDAEATAALAAIEEAEKNQGLALKCKACSETFNTSLAFRKHVAWTHKKKVCIQENGVFICSVCDFRTKKKDVFATHLQRKHDTWARNKRQSSNNVFPCSACGFVCRSKHSLQSHFIRKHTDRYEHECKFCPKKFKVKGDLTNHIRFHHKERPVKCDVCDKVCLNSGSLYVHQKWAHYKPKFECRICHRRMVTQENLDSHMIMQHQNREKVTCPDCGKTFAKKDSYKRHMSVHTGVKPYKCVICSKIFARRSQLRQHLLIHTGKRPFVCELCGKAFTQKPGLICHRKTHPGNHPPLPVMPIGELVKEFTEEYLAAAAGKNQKSNKDIVEQLEQLQEEEEEDGEEEEEEEEEEYEETIEEAIVINEDSDTK